MKIGNTNIEIEKYTGYAFGAISLIALYYRMRFKGLKRKLSKMGD
jgi:hypothetical protein|tara:strand:- start:16508 stop:16642 length:135 start_codon:yes stop_codon:yes gene_type:complete